MKMRKHLLTSFVIAGVVMMHLIQSCCPPDKLLGSTSTTLRAQETSMWCWAASGEMCMDFLGTNVTQCDEANKRFGRSDCCNSTVPNACVNGGWPEFDKYNFTFVRTSDKPLSWAALKKQIYCKHKPVAFSWHWMGGGGHMMVVYGYAQIGDTRYLAIHDPWAPNVGGSRFITYEEYVSGTGHTHWDDFYEIAKKK